MNSDDDSDEDEDEINVDDYLTDPETDNSLYCFLTKV